MPAKKLTFWATSGFLWQHLASFIKNKIKQSKNKAICYHILVFTVLKEQRVASSQKIHQGRCFTFIKGQRDNCLFSKMNLPVLYIPCQNTTFFFVKTQGLYFKLTLGNLPGCNLTKLLYKLFKYVLT